MKIRLQKGFSLVELLVILGILAMLGTIAAPEFRRFLDRADKISCANNLRQIGVGVLSYVAENDGKFPIVEPNPDDPVYDPEKYEAKPLFEEIKEYGLSGNVLRCPADAKGKSAAGVIYFDTRQTSYQWRVLVDDENAIAPKIYGGRRGASVRIVKPSRVTLCSDFEAIHPGMNRLYGDGSVRGFR